MLAALALLQIAAASAPPAPSAPHNEIVVTGRSLKGLQDDLAACVARRCPAREDVIASVRYAEGLFRVARYQDSRRVLQQAIARDKNAGQQDPYAIAALYEATATVARHDGEQAVVADAVHARARLLRETQASDNVDLLRAELDEADLLLQRNGVQRAMEAYRELMVRAVIAHQPGIAASCLIREAQVQHAIGQNAVAARLLDRVIEEGDSVPAGYRLTAYAAKARLPHAPGDTSAVDALRAALARVPQATPVLLYAPIPPTAADNVDLDYYNVVDRVTQGGDFSSLHWADIGFTIHPDGTVADAEKLRGTLGNDQASEIAKTIGQRRYAAIAGADGDRYRVERWTLTADYGTPTKSLIRRRYINPHYETLDVTNDARDAGSKGATS